jgi:signal transduction histidine kinase
LAIASAGFGAAFARQASDPVGRWLELGLVAAWALAAATTTVRRPGERLGPLVLWATLVGALASLSASVLSAHAHGTDVSRAALDVAQLGRALGVALLPILAMHLLLGLPDGTCRLSRSTLALGYAVGIGLGIGLWTQRPSLPLWPLAVEAVLATAAGVAGSARRYRRAQGHERQRMQWFGWAVAVGIEAVVVVGALRLLIGWPPHAGVVAAAATVLIPLSLVFASSRHMIAHIDRLLVHTVSVAGLTFVVAAVYLVIVVGLGRVPTDQESSLLALSMAAAAAAALLYLPTRRRLSRAANRLVYGEREAPDEALRTFGSRLSRAIPLDELLLQVVESLRKTFNLERAEIWTGSGGQLERAVSVPDTNQARLSLSPAEETVVARAGVVGPAWLAVWLPQLTQGGQEATVRVVPLAYAGQLLGLIVAMRPPAGDTFGPDDESALAELARQVAVALHNLQLDSALQASLDEVRRQAEELRASRARIVAASDAARRKIERDLHDGAQQHLVALAVNLRLARQLAEADPDKAQEILERLGDDIQDTVQQLRNLAHGIYPPLLVDRGVGEALAAAATRAALPVAVDANGVGRYPPEVEAAVYFCCLEALQNAGKHAGAGASATVRVWEEAGGLLFEVEDDGAGFEMKTRRQLGAGFVNMGDRVGAIGGSVSVQSAPGQGTRISGRIALPSTR